MYTLFIDTHSDTITLVLYQHHKILEQLEISSKQDHSMTTIPSIVSLLEKQKLDIHDINEILVVNGPGSFTGVRIGVTIAKTLAFTLTIPIKTITSLEVKAVSIEHDTIHIVEREKNGVFVGFFDKKNNLLEDLTYLKTSEYEEIQDKNNYKENIKIDYEKVILYMKDKKSINPHAVNPLYVKKIEVQK